MAMPDFTSVLYLGMSHAHHDMRPWRDLTTGRPAALASSYRAVRLAESLAHFMGHETAARGTSTLQHLLRCLRRPRARRHRHPRRCGHVSDRPLGS